jgi:hypothetical protein
VFLDGADEVDASIVDEIVDRAEALLGLTMGLNPLLSSMTASAVLGNDTASACVGATLRAAQPGPLASGHVPPAHSHAHWRLR